ncbi:MAG TPA: tetratricopeptide repeat protein [Acidimicrobiales bacterium]|nr:tetratricopeptide repeat protein [Acidimicrobiales bacterium]
MAAAGLLAACGGPSPSAGKVDRGTTTEHQTPATLEPKLERAIAEENEGRYATAAATFLAVVKADPKNTIAWYDLGVMAHRNGQDTQALNDYRRALGGDPKYLPALYNLAELVAPGDPKEAVALYRKVLAIDPKDAAARLNQGFALLAEGKTAEGKAALAEAIKLDPSLASRVPVADGGTASGTAT